MDTQLLQPVRKSQALEIDFIGDLACPWSYIGTRNLTRALGNLYGAPARVLRWHGLPLAGVLPSAWRQHLATRLPDGTSVDEAYSKLKTVGRAIGIEFNFESITRLPDTREAHRLVHLAAGSERQTDLIGSIFKAFFERSEDIGDPSVLSRLAAEHELEPAVREAFTSSAAGRDDVIAEERRLRGLGIEGVPNLLLNSRVMVPGAGDVATYIQALDQAVFPEVPTAARRRLLH